MLKVLLVNDESVFSKKNLYRNGGLNARRIMKVNQIIENQQPTLTPSTGEPVAWRTTATSPNYGGRLLERQAEAGASGVPQGLGK